MRFCLPRVVEDMSTLGVTHVYVGTLFWGPYNKDPTIWGTTYGSSNFRKCQYVYIYTDTHTHVQTSIRPSIHPSIHASIHPSIHPCMHACMHAHIHIIYDSLPRLIQEIVVMSDARNTSQDLLSFARGFMVSLHWGAILGYLIWLDVRRPSISELAVQETSELRRELEELRKLLSELDRATSGCEWTAWGLAWSARLLLITWVLIIGLLLNWGCRDRAPSIPPRVPQLQLTDSQAVDQETPSSRASVSPRALPKTRPVRPSDLRRRDG